MYLFFFKERPKNKKGAMDSLLDKMFDDLQISFGKKFTNHLYRIKVTKIRKSFYVLIRKKEEKF